MPFPGFSRGQCVTRCLCSGIGGDLVLPSGQSSLDEPVVESDRVEPRDAVLQFAQVAHANSAETEAFRLRRLPQYGVC